MTQSHTPTPWEVQRHDHDDGTIGYEIWANGQYICSMPVFDEVDEASAKANAAFIVKAVNEYEKLKLALRDLLDQVDTLSDFTFNGDMENHEHETCFEGAVDHARSLLKALDAKAGAI